MKRAWGIANSWNVDRSLPGDDEVRMARIVDRLCWEFPEIPRSQLVAMIYGTDATSDGAAQSTELEHNTDPGHSPAAQPDNPLPG